MSMPSSDPGRGTLILVMGILSIVCCGILGPIAWALGASDLKRINAGQISPEARGLTQAGMICGIIGTILLVLGLIWGVFLGGFAAFSARPGMQPIPGQPQRP